VGVLVSSFYRSYLQIYGTLYIVVVIGHGAHTANFGQNLMKIATIRFAVSCENTVGAAAPAAHRGRRDGA